MGVRDYAQAAESLGYTHLLAYDHVLGVGLEHRPDWKGAYSENDLFHEVLVLFGYLAGLTTRLEFVTGVLILPQRETALVAKQAAEVDVLSGGRLRIGVGVGWNEAEYDALGQDFHVRGKRVEEQIELLRLLWTKPVVSFEGKWDRIPDAGLNPLPVQQPIPIWIGGYQDVTLRRAARIGDGYFPSIKPAEVVRPEIEKLRQYALEEGRDPASIGIEPRINVRGDDTNDWRRKADAWRELGATHLSINTMGGGLNGPQEHIKQIERAARLSFEL